MSKRIAFIATVALAAAGLAVSAATASRKTQTVKSSHSGNTYSNETQAQGGTNTQKTRWEATDIKLLSINIESPFAGNFSCTYNPPPVIAHIPAHPETFPQQKLNGSGNACGAARRRS